MSPFFRLFLQSFYSWKVETGSGTTKAHSANFPPACSTHSVQECDKQSSTAIACFGLVFPWAMLWIWRDSTAHTTGANPAKKTADQRESGNSKSSALHNKLACGPIPSSSELEERMAVVHDSSHGSPGPESKLQTVEISPCKPAYSTNRPDVRWARSPINAQ